MPVAFISNYLKSQQICERKIDVPETLRDFAAVISKHLKFQQIDERKIDVTATLRHAPSKGAQFGVSFQRV